VVAWIWGVRAFRRRSKDLDRQIDALEQTDLSPTAPRP